MGHSLEKIPKYLLFTIGKKKIYKPKNFRFYHLLFITGFKNKSNPIEFPQTLTAISVCWSKLIIPQHVLLVVNALASNPDGRGDHVYYEKVNKLKKFKIEDEYLEGDYKGKHILTVDLIHSPIEFNYSHSEILIKHIYTKNGVIQTDIITKDIYDSKKCLLRKNGHKDFFKPLLLKYRAKMATSLNNDIRELDIPWYFRILPKNIIVNFSLWKAMTFTNR
jgi:hypothetical protein